MATNMDKALYQAPEGLDMIVEGEGEMEVEMPGVEIEVNDDGSVEISLGEKPEKEKKELD